MYDPRRPSAPVHTPAPVHAPNRVIDDVPAPARGGDGSSVGLRRLTTVAAFAGLAAAAPVAPASAHGIGGDAAESGVLGFVPIGVEHMLLGWDHLAFVAGVLLLAGTARRAVKLISLFVLGHSTTLILATELAWRVDAGLVDAVIAASVAFVGCVGIYGRPRRYRLLGVAVLGYGLVHGLGLATRFQDLGIPPEGRLAKVIAFNVGIEIGQATAVLGLFAVANLVASSSWWRERDERAAKALQLTSAGLFIAGAVAAAYIATDAFGPDNDVERADLPSGTSCAIGNRTTTLPSEGGDHPPSAFFGPDETTPIEDFGHSLGDGYVVVLYSPDATEADVAALRDLVDTIEPAAVLAGPSDDLDASVSLEAWQLSHVLSCADIEVEGLRSFVDSWLDQTVR